MVLTTLFASRGSRAWPPEVHRRAGAQPSDLQEASPLTAVLQTDGAASDAGVLYGHPMDPDLRKRTRLHWPDALYATMDQKVGVRVLRAHPAHGP